MRTRYSTFLMAICLCAGFSIAIPPARAHGIVGKRMFIEALATEDANVKNELALPVAEFLVEPDGTWRTIGFSFEKALYPRKFSLLFGESRIYRHQDSNKFAGYDNLELGLKWQAYQNDAHEFVLSPALFVTVPTGSEQVVQREATLRPAIAYGKGFGDLPSAWLRPLAIQGDFAYETSLSGERWRQLNVDSVLMYSIPYLNRWVRDADAGYSLEHNLRSGFSRGALLGNLFPFIEFNASIAVDGMPGGTSSTLRPGLLWMGKYVQISLAADIPIQGPAIADRHTGACIMVDWFLDEIFPWFGWTPFGR